MKNLKTIVVITALGFSSADLMRRAFVRLLGITPRRYREVAVSSIQRPSK